ncbi:hypothetical protein M5E87_13765 [Flavonifractor plautii]|nr:hypothetical protein M5E87_13765 [Flavonifractor plautii]
MPISENAKAVLERRYLARDEQGQPTETVDGLFRRVANAVAEGDRRFDSKADVVATAKEFYELMVSLDFLPNSPTLMNAGRPWASSPPASCCRWPTPWRTSSTPSRTPR